MSSEIISALKDQLSYQDDCGCHRCELVREVESLTTTNQALMAEVERLKRTVAVYYDKLEAADAYLTEKSAEVEALRGQVPPQAAVDVLAERQRQIEKEGWTALHDDSHEDSFALSKAAACYARYAGEGYFKPAEWPWSLEWWKPTTPRRDLVKAGALILAEIERLDRQSQPLHAEEVKP
jgi:hypothetical protein